jgi:hypothetical protein
MSNEDRRLRREAIRKTLRHNAARRAEMWALREKNVHAVDQYDLWANGRQDTALVRELRGIGGSGDPYEVEK